MSKKNQIIETVALLSDRVLGKPSHFKYYVEEDTNFYIEKAGEWILDIQSDNLESLLSSVGMRWRLSWSPDGTEYPTWGVSGFHDDTIPLGPIKRGDCFFLSGPYNVGGIDYPTGTLFICNTDDGTTGTSWQRIADWGKVVELLIDYEKTSNKDTDGTLSANSDTKYPSQKAVKTYADTKQAALGFTPENVTNKAINFTTKNDTLYPSTLAVYNEIIAQITALVNSSPATLDTLAELANALGNDPNYATTIATALGNRLIKTGDTITGDIANNASGYIRVAWGSTAQRPVTPLDGMIRHNGSLGRFEFYSGGAWRNYARLDGDTFTGNIFALNLSGTNSGDETTATIGALINAALSATPNDSDLIGLSAGSILKKLSITSLKAFLKTYFDTIYTTGTSSIVPKISAHETFRGITTRNGSTTTDSSGGITLTVDASVAAKTIASTTYLTKQIRIGYYHTVVATGHMLDLRFNGSLFYIGAGFRYVLEFGIPDTVYASGCRQFHGFQASTLAPTYSDTVQVDSLTDIVGFGSESTDTNLQVFYNDSSGVASKIDLGASFPANRTSGAELTTMYSVTLYNEIGSSSVLYRIVNGETGAVAEGTISTNLPSTSTALTMVTSRCMGGGGGNNNTGRLDIGMFGVYSVYTK